MISPKIQNEMIEITTLIRLLLTQKVFKNTVDSRDYYSTHKTDVIQNISYHINLVYR